MHLKTETSVMLPQSVTPSSYVLSMSIWCNNFWNDNLLKKLQVDLPYSLAINQCSRFTLEFKFTFLSMVDVSIYKVKMTSFNLSHQKDRFKIMLCVVEECISLNLISAQLQKETPPRWLTGDGTTNCWKKKRLGKKRLFWPLSADDDGMWWLLLLLQAANGQFNRPTVPFISDLSYDDVTISGNPISNYFFACLVVLASQSI